MTDFIYDDGSAIHVAATEDGRVSVYQGSGGTQGRGAAFISPDEAEQLARSIYQASQDARGDAGAHATEESTSPAAAAAVSEPHQAPAPAYLPLGADPIPVPELPVNPSPVDAPPAE